MPTSSLFALIDDIATLLDDVSVMTKVAAKKTAGVLGDDLALNAQQVTGLSSNRELPVVWRVAKGSAINKVILVPLALTISALLPWAVMPLMMIGGAFLCFEGVEKLAHKFLHADDESEKQELVAAAHRSPEELLAFEQGKIKGAVRTDFILSAEIIILTLGTVAQSTFTLQVLVLCAISAIMTVGVYGLVAGIVKLDDLGLYWVTKESSVLRKLGHLILRTAPLLMKTLSYAGTAAMFLVGGGIITHGVPALHHASEDIKAFALSFPVAGGVVAGVSPLLFDLVVGLAAGAAVFAVYSLVIKLRRK